jgi:hypothetical protein
LHHPLYHYSNTYFEMVESKLIPVPDSSGFKQGSPASLDSGDNVSCPLNIEESALLAGK